MTIFLRCQKVLGIVNGTRPCPTQDHTQFDLWTQCNDIVLSWIHATLSVNETLLNFDCQTAFEAWTILGQLFQDNAAATQMHTRQQFQHFQKGELSMDEYLQLHSLFTNLKVVGEQVQENDLVAQALLGLPIPYNGFITAMNT
ncbi:hypothetical protein LIER_14889 [Lithospermum erythrorhizon]|uniref:Retrotransposon gag domain-containing protein n=1 Tax=Lithospermum erythrorhizon TaxID=34254 RepID=A0AAV3Q0S1_LITER